MASAGTVFARATPAELKQIYRDLFRVEFDLEKQTGQLFLQLAGGDARSVTDGRSASTKRYASGPGIWVATLAA